MPKDIGHNANVIGQLTRAENQNSLGAAARARSTHSASCAPNVCETSSRVGIVTASMSWGGMPSRNLSSRDKYLPRKVRDAISRHTEIG